MCGWLFPSLVRGAAPRCRFLVLPKPWHPPAAASLGQVANSAPLPQSLQDPKASRYQLACLLWRVKCDEGLILHLRGERCMEGIAACANFYILDIHEAKLAEEVDRASLMGNSLQVSRLRPTWQLARAELYKAMESLSQAQSSSSPSDLDDPLDEEPEAKRAKSFGEAYDGFTFESDSMPLARIIGRIFRELSSPKRSISTIPLKRMRTEGDGAGLVPPKTMSR